MAYTLYGIPNCDTMKKARSWLAENGIAHDFHDYKKSGITRDLLEAWVGEHGLKTILNTAGTTFRKLSEAERADLTDAKGIELMLAQPSMIKRPILDLGNKRIVGFKADIYEAALKA